MDRQGKFWGTLHAHLLVPFSYGDADECIIALPLTFYQSILFRGSDFGFEVRSQSNMHPGRDQTFHDVELFKDAEKIV